MAAKADGAPKADAALFFRRLKQIYDSWKEDASGAKWKGAATLVLLYGRPKEEVLYQKSNALMSWLFGYEMPDTLIIFTRDGVHVLATQKKKAFMQPVLEAAAPTAVVPVTFHERNTGDRDAANFAQLLERMRGHGSTTGMLLKDSHDGDFASGWQAALEASGLERVEISGGVSPLLAIKDAGEQKHVRNAAQISALMMRRHFVTRLEKVLDENQRTTHAKLAEFIDQLFQQPDKISAKLGADSPVESCYTPIVQSGGNYDLKPSAYSDDEPLHFGTILCSLGARWKSYCSNVGRTFLVQPKPEQTAAYATLLAAQAEALRLLRPGTPLSAVYDGVRAAVGAALEPYLTASLGFGMGIEFREAALAITAKSQLVVAAGMVFNLAVGLQNIPFASPASDAACDQRYSLLLADTVVVSPDSGAEIVTQGAPKSLEEISYDFSKGRGAGAAAAIDAQQKAKLAALLPGAADASTVKGRLRGDAAAGAGSKSSSSATTTTTTTSSVSSAAALAEDRRKLAQSDAARRRLEEAAERHAKERISDELARSQMVLDTVAYRDVSQFPREAVPNRVFVDTVRQAVLLPIYGQLVPFHISVIKSVSKTEDYLRINFVSPGATLGAASRETAPQIAANPDAAFIREVTFRCPDVKNLNNSFRLIKELRKRVTEIESAKREMASLQKQEKLVLNKTGKNPRLSDLYVRPNLAGRRTRGALEAHRNGFRFTLSKGGVEIDILYKNIKHAFFQPAENELIVLLHFHLHDAIMLGKKKTTDVQFYTEVMELSQSLDNQKRAWGEDEEIEEENRERRLMARLNDEFQKFVQRVEQHITSMGEESIEFDIPYKELGFYGVPAKSRVMLLPTVNCLVNLVEPPFLVVTLNDIEVVHFERVQLSLKNFDMVIIYKDYHAPVVHINTIPIESLDTIKDWLRSCAITFYEGTQNLNWNRIMQTIRDDPDFHANGGWDFLKMDGSDDDDEDQSDDSGDDYAPDAGDGDGSGGDYDDDDDDDDEYSSDASADDDDEYGSDDEDESEGEDWDELERKAAKADAERGKYDEDVRKRKKKNSEYSDDDDAGGGDDDDDDDRKRSGKKLKQMPVAKGKSSSAGKPPAKTGGSGRR